MSKDLLIFCVEDDLDIQNLELYTLKANNYNVKGFTNGEELFNELEHAIPSLILLDLMLPLMDGNTILKKLKSKEKFKNIPVIICSAKGSEFNKVALLNEGADDYLVKPFGMMELVARVNAVLRRITKEKQVVLSNGNIRVDLEKHEAYVDNKEIVLNPRKQYTQEINIENTYMIAETKYDLNLEKYLFFRLMKTYKEGDEIKNIILLEDKYGKETDDEDRGDTELELGIQHEIVFEDEEGVIEIPVIMYNETKEKDEIKLNERNSGEYENKEQENPTFDTALGQFNLIKKQS